jgi:hypothetical protein
MFGYFPGERFDYYDVVEVRTIVLNEETGARMKVEELVDPPNCFPLSTLADNRVKEKRRMCPGRWFKMRMNGGRPTKRY